MTITDIDPDDISTNPTKGHAFDDIIRRRTSRRSVLAAGGMTAAATFLTNELPGAASAATGSHGGRRARHLLGFDPIPLGIADEIVVPEGYTARPFIPWGTPLTGSHPPFVPGTPPFVPGGNTGAEQEQQLGMHHDGMHYFARGKGRRGNTRGVLAVNHEFTDERYLHTGTTALPPTTSWTADMVRKSQAAHGVSVVAIEEEAPGSWTVKRSRLNRRITANTPMSFSGPAAGHRLVRTAADPAGRSPIGTFNNCSHGVTPWDTS